MLVCWRTVEERRAVHIIHIHKPKRNYYTIMYFKWTLIGGPSSKGEMSHTTRACVQRKDKGGSYVYSVETKVINTSSY